MGKYADTAGGLASVTLSLRSEEAALISHAALVAHADLQSAMCEAMTAAGDPDGADYALAAAIAERIARTVAEQLDQFSDDADAEPLCDSDADITPISA